MFIIGGYATKFQACEQELKKEQDEDLKVKRVKKQKLVINSEKEEFEYDCNKLALDCLKKNEFLKGTKLDFDESTKKIVRKASRLERFLYRKDSGRTREKTFKLAFKTLLVLKQTAEDLKKRHQNKFFYERVKTRLFDEEVCLIRITEEKVAIYAIEKKIGEGVFNTTLLISNLLKARYEVYRALKPVYCIDGYHLGQARKETALHRMVMAEIGPGIVKMYRGIDQAAYYGSFLEYCNGEDLEKFLGILNEKEKRNILLDIFEIVNKLHETHIIHNDLNLKNILIAFEEIGGKCHFKAKLADFGLSFHLDNKSAIDANCYILPPQVLSRKIGLGYYSDNWALGLIAFQVKYQCLPAFNAKQKEMLKKGITEKVLSKVVQILSKDVEDLQSDLNLENPYDQLIAGLLCLDCEQQLTSGVALKRLMEIPADCLEID